MVREANSIIYIFHVRSWMKFQYWAQPICFETVMPRLYFQLRTWQNTSVYFLIFFFAVWRWKVYNLHINCTIEETQYSMHCISMKSCMSWSGISRWLDGHIGTQHPHINIPCVHGCCIKYTFWWTIKYPQDGVNRFLFRSETKVCTHLLYVEHMFSSNMPLKIYKIR